MMKNFLARTSLHSICSVSRQVSILHRKQLRKVSTLPVARLSLLKQTAEKLPAVVTNYMETQPATDPSWHIVLAKFATKSLEVVQTMLDTNTLAVSLY